MFQLQPNSNNIVSVTTELDIHQQRNILKSNHGVCNQFDILNVINELMPLQSIAVKVFFALFELYYDDVESLNKVPVQQWTKKQMCLSLFSDVINNDIYALNRNQFEFIILFLRYIEQHGVSMKNF